jgi:DNA phosphorothioation-associated putative methyltransferase
LFSVGSLAGLDRVFRSASVGKLMPTALYVHASAIGRLPTELRIYEGCARGYVGAVEGANIVKLHRDEAKVSYLVYPDFDRDAHPALARAVTVPLQTFRLDIRDYLASTNPPVLHRKEEFVADDHPSSEKFRRLTLQEERFGLYRDPARIGTRAGWDDALARAGVSIRGHRVVRDRALPQP